jgi:hypothetical protein
MPNHFTKVFFLASVLFARILAIVILASFCKGAFVIYLTLSLNTFNIGIAKESRWACTLAGLTIRGTYGSWAAWAWITWIRGFNANLILAYESTSIQRLAIRISRTFRSTTCNGIGFGNQFS